jgi:C4-dicarboxylate-binding protein DctP
MTASPRRPRPIWLRVALILVISALSGACGPSAERPYVIKFPHVTAPDTPKGRAAEQFRELAEQRFAGRIRVEVYPAGQLMDDSDSLEALAFGDIQMIAASLSVFDRWTDRFQVFDLPHLFPNLAAVERFQHSETGRGLLDSLEHRGIRGLAFWHNGMKQLSASRPLRRPDDAEGLKFRIMESDVLQAQVLALGGNPQKMAFGEVYHALQTGTVNAQENTWSNIYSSRFYEVQPFITETNHGYIGYFVAVNDRFWQSLPDDLRAGLEQVLREVSATSNALAEAINLAHREQIAASGRAEIIALNADERHAWRVAMHPVWAEFAPRIGPELVAAAQRAASGP